MLLIRNTKYCLFSKINYTHHQLTKLVIILVRAHTSSCLFFHLKSQLSQWVPLVKQQLHPLKLVSTVYDPVTNALVPRCIKITLWAAKGPNTWVTRLNILKNIKETQTSNSNWSIASAMSISKEMQPLKTPMTCICFLVWERTRNLRLHPFSQLSYPTQRQRMYSKIKYKQVWVICIVTLSLKLYTEWGGEDFSLFLIWNWPSMKRSGTQ